MRAWRLCRAPYQALDGKGARLYGGRWNSPGRNVVYAASTLSLAALEYLAHIDIADIPDDLVAIQVELPADAAVENRAVSSLPRDWRRAVAPVGCQRIGDGWIADNRALALLVPSVLVPEEFNVLVNPQHAEMEAVAIVSVRDFVFDARLIG